MVDMGKLPFYVGLLFALNMAVLVFDAIYLTKDKGVDRGSPFTQRNESNMDMADFVPLEVDARDLLLFLYEAREVMDEIKQSSVTRVEGLPSDEQISNAMETDEPTSPAVKNLLEQLKIVYQKWGYDFPDSFIGLDTPPATIE